MSVSKGNRRKSTWSSKYGVRIEDLEIGRSYKLKDKCDLDGFQVNSSGKIVIRCFEIFSSMLEDLGKTVTIRKIYLDDYTVYTNESPFYWPIECLEYI